MTKMHVRMIIEIMGKPASNVKEALAGLIDKLGKEKGVKILDRKIHEPVPIEENKEFFTTFSEIEAEFESVANYLGIIFAYMPSNIEIISPENLDLKNVDLTELGNRLIDRLHGYDAIAKRLVFERNALINQLNALAGKVKGAENNSELKRISLESKPNSKDKSKKNKKGKKRK